VTATLPADLPYTIQGGGWSSENLVIGPAGSLVFEPDTIVKFSIDQKGSVENIRVEGTLDARGTADQPVTFTSLNDDTIGGDTNNDGDWNSIRIASTGTGTFDHAVLRYGGYNTHGIGMINITTHARTCSRTIIQGASFWYEHTFVR
jgi:hypothetical protein